MFTEIENSAEKKNNRMLTIFLMALWMAALIGELFFITPAHAQMNNESWGFKQQNRASIAALMQQVESSGDATTVASAGGYDQLVCGGDGQSSATGNSTCIIMNNSNGAIELGQTSEGSQDATTTENTTMNGLSDVLENIAE